MKIENIKFKAKRLDGKGWVEGNLRTSKSGNSMIIPIEYEGACSVDPSTVCQFTGARDCDGTPIYEHDLLICREIERVYEVVWNQDNTSFSLYNAKHNVLYTSTLGIMLHHSHYSFKVIGNKFDKEGGKQ